MLNKFILFAVIFVFSASIGLAQTTDDKHEFEVFVGYSNNQVDFGSPDDSDLNNTFKSRQPFSGFEVSGVKNVSRFVGIKGDFSAQAKEIQFSVPTDPDGTTSETVKITASLYNFLGGVQFKDNRKESGRVRPFAHVLVGAAHARTRVKSFTGGLCDAEEVDCTDLKGGDTGFAAALGGGIDVKLNNRFSIRAIQADYNPTRLNGTTQHNFRFGVGVVFH
ncbi:MAG TPA: outer membrane beta-barrel protein [Pyrinomonadaceae bacterium]|nr:outer membrane beta-barrel protein [Pyrinomonadaceae bacterium]